MSDDDEEEGLTRTMSQQQYASAIRHIDTWNDALQEVKAQLLGGLGQCHMTASSASRLLTGLQDRMPHTSVESRDKRRVFVKRESVENQEQQLLTAVQCTRLALGEKPDDPSYVQSPINPELVHSCFGATPAGSEMSWEAMLGALDCIEQSIIHANTELRVVLESCYKALYRIETEVTHSNIIPEAASESREKRQGLVKLEVLQSLVKKLNVALQCCPKLFHCSGI